MLTVQLFCLPCLIFPALLLAAQFVYNRVAFIKQFVQWLFPGLAVAEANAKAAAEEDNARKQREFFGGDAATTTAAATDAAASSKEAAASDGNGSTSNKKKQ